MSTSALRYFYSKSLSYLIPLSLFAEVYQTQSNEIYRQMKAAAHATEQASIQRDRAFAREKALSEEVDILHVRLQNKSEEVRGVWLTL